MSRQSHTFQAKRVSPRWGRMFNALDTLVSHFKVSSVPGFLVPESPVSIEDVVKAFFDTEDPIEIWQEAPASSLIGLAWDNGPGGSSTFGLDAVTTPSKRRVYVSASDNFGLHVVAATPRTFRPESEDARFLRAVVETNGEVFDAMVLSGSLPDEFGISASSDEEAIDLCRILLDAADLMNDLRDDTDFWWADYGRIEHRCPGQTPVDDGGWPPDCSCPDGVIIEGWLRNQGVIRPLPKPRKREHRAKASNRGDDEDL